MDIYFEQKPIGELYVAQEGLYYHFHCRCPLQSTRVLRLYAVSGRQSKPIGVMMPCEGAFVLDEKISMRRWQMPKMECAICGYALENGALPWRGRVDDVEVEGWVLGESLYLPDDEAFPLPAQWETARFETINGTSYAVISLT